MNLPQNIRKSSSPLPFPPYALLVQQAAGADVILLGEASCEVFRVVEPYLVGDFRDAHALRAPAFQYQLVRQVEAVATDELCWRLPEQVLQLRVEQRLTDPGLFAEGAHLEVRVLVMRLHDFHHAAYELLVARPLVYVQCLGVHAQGELPLEAFAVLQYVLYARQEQGFVEGLEQVFVHADAVALDARLLRGLGREHQEGDVRDGEVLLHPARQLDAVHHGHHQVADDEVRLLRVQHLEGLLPVGGFGHLVLPAQDGAYVAAHVGIVLHHKDAERAGDALGRLHGHVGACRPAVRRNGSGRRGLPYGQEQAERAPLPAVVAHADGAAHGLYDAFAEVKPDAAARLPVHGVLVLVLHLIEAVEDVLQILFRDAAARVAHTDVEPFAVLPRGREQGDEERYPSAVGRELDGVAQQVGQ